MIKNNTFYIFLFVFFLQFLFDQFVIIALPWVILEINNSARFIGGIFFLISIVKIITLLFSGFLIDKKTPNNIIKYVSLLGFIFSILFFYFLFSKNYNVYILLIFSASISILSALLAPARITILPKLVEPSNLQQANSFLIGAQQISLLIGPVVAGTIISSAYDTSTIFLIGSLFLLFSFLVISFFDGTKNTLNHRNIKSSSNINVSLKEAFNWIFKDKKLTILISYSASTTLLLSGLISIGLPYLIKNHLLLGAQALGLLLTSYGVGNIIGIIVSNIFQKKNISIGIVICIMDCFVGFVLIGIGLSNSIIITSILMGMVGFGGGLIQVTTITWIQKRIPDHLQGRVISIMTLVITLMSPLSILLVTLLISIKSITNVFLLIGILLFMFSLTILLFFNKELRSIVSKN